ncbi:MAG: hypothetical protein PHH70_03920 [Candidatus Gracilibacteria bacterium]|nr:hypothetical protein [Candidatus Gracilibacteria bacterium]
MAGPETIDIKTVNGKIETQINEVGVKRAIDALNNKYGNSQIISQAVIDKIKSFDGKNSPLFSMALGWKMSLDEAITGKTADLEKNVFGLGFKTSEQTRLANRPNASHDAVPLDIAQKVAQLKTAHAQQSEQIEQTPKFGLNNIRSYAQGPKIPL